MKHEKIFEKGFEATLKYMEANDGNPNAPSIYKTDDGFNLAAWQRSVRIKYRNNKLSQDKVKRFEEIGFLWEPRAKASNDSFEKGFQATLLYMKEHNGNPNAGRQYKTGAGFRLGNWQDYIRKRYRLGKISEERIQKLTDIGFIWGLNDVAFERNLRATLNYKKKNNGNPNALRKYVTPEGLKLGAWQFYMRTRYKQNKLPDFQLSRLEEIGFAWDKIAYNFEKGFNATLRYMEQNDGNPNAPLKYKTPDGFKLGYWQSSIRCRYKNGALAPEKIKKFENIGFIWNHLEAQFERGVKATLMFKDQNGNDPNAPHSYITPDGFKLGAWQRDLRVRIRKGKVAADKVKRLESLGFVCNKIVDQFETGYNATLDYMKQNDGNPNARRDYITPEGFTLGNWQSYVRGRFKRGKLAPEKIEALDKIGFKWNIINPLRDNQFEKGYIATIEYMKTHGGNPNSSQHFKSSDGFNLGLWQSRVRERYKKKKLSPARIEKLEKLGFIWNLREARFERGFQETVKYKKNNKNNPNAPEKYITPEGFKLGSWQKNLKRNYKRGRLSAERLKRLERIGFRMEKRKAVK